MSEVFRWRKPSSFTTLLDLEETGRTGFEETLRELGGAVDSTPGFEVARVKSLHFLRMQVIGPASSAGWKTPASARLLFCSVYDGDLREHLEELMRHTGDWLETHVAPQLTGQGPPLVEQLLGGQMIEDTVFLGEAHVTVGDTLAEARLREVLGRLADEGWNTGQYRGDRSAESIRIDLRDQVDKLADLDLPRQPRPTPSLPAQALQWLDAGRCLIHPLSGLLGHQIREWSLTSRFARTRAGRALLRAFLFGHRVWTWLPTRLFLALVRREQRRESDLEVRPRDEDVQRLREREDHQVQNPLTLVATVRGSAARRWILRRILAGAASATRHIWNQGKLAGIGTIHCARVLQIDGGRQMLFLSDYDGAWERYLADFLGPGRLAVVPIFTNLEGCPPTDGLFDPTPGFGPRFLEFTRHEQAPVHVWYSAYPEISMSNRLSNRRLRDGLFAKCMTEEEASAWLRELE